MDRLDEGGTVSEKMNTLTMPHVSHAANGLPAAACLPLAVVC